MNSIGSAPTLPGTTPHPKAQAFLMNKSTLVQKSPSTKLKRANLGAFGLGSVALPGSAEEQLAYRALQKDFAKQSAELNALREKNSELRRAENELKIRVKELGQESAVRRRLASDIESSAHKSRLRYDRLIEALAALPLDEETVKQINLEQHMEGASNSNRGGEAQQAVQPQIALPTPTGSPSRSKSRSVPKVVKSNKTKIQWGGSNDAMFKNALTTVARERGEMLARATQAEKKVISLKARTAQLERRIQELEFDIASRPKPEDLLCSSCGSRGTISLEGAEEDSSQHSGSARSSSKTNSSNGRRRSKTRTEEESEVLKEQHGMGSSTNGLFAKAVHELGLGELLAEHKPVDEEEDEYVEGSNKNIPLKRKQLMGVLDLVQRFQTCAPASFHLTHDPEHLISASGGMGSFFENFGTICASLAPGTKHVSLWIADATDESIWTRSHRQGREVRFSIVATATQRGVGNNAKTILTGGGIAGECARSGVHKLHNNCILGETDLHYTPTVDHLGSSREFLDVNNPKERYQRQSLLTIPIFDPSKTGVPESCSDGYDGSGAHTSAFLPKCIAVLQVSKSASKAIAVNKRAFDPAELVALSSFAHSAVWVLQNSLRVSQLEIRDKALAKILKFPLSVVDSLTRSPSERNSESAKVELIECIEHHVTQTLPGAQACRIFALASQGTSSKSQDPVQKPAVSEENGASVDAEPAVPQVAAEPAAAAAADTKSTEKEGKTPRTRLYFVPGKSRFDFESQDDQSALEKKQRKSCDFSAALCGTVATEHKTIVLDAAYNDPRFNANIDLDEKGVGLISAPIRAEHSRALLGVLQVAIILPKGPERESTIDMVANEMLPQIALAINLAQIPIGEK